MTVTAEDLRVDEAYVEPVRPRTRGDCVGGARPCPWASCRFSLLADVNPKTGAVTENGEVDEMAVTCALDAADLDRPLVYREIAPLFNVARQRVQQIEEEGLATMKKRLDPDSLAAWASTREIIPDADLSDVIDPEFKAQVQRAYERIIPRGERGDQAIRSLTRTPR